MGTKETFRCKTCDLVFTGRECIPTMSIMGSGLYLPPEANVHIDPKTGDISCNCYDSGDDYDQKDCKDGD